MTDAPETMTHGELYKRAAALIERVEKVASKSTLVLMLATDTVYTAWYRTGAVAGIEQAEAELLKRIEEWSRNGRMHNTARRSERVLQKFKENCEAREAGRRAPHRFAVPKKRRKRRAAK